jgi:protein gp37
MTKIEWTHRPGAKGVSWNPVRARNKETGGVGHFCVKVSEGCKYCYAARFQPRFRNPVRYAAQDADKVEIFLDEKVLMQPIGWKEPHTVFVCSMTDLFYAGHSDDWIDRIFAIMALCPQHTFIIPSKRPDRMHEYAINFSLARTKQITDGYPSDQVIEQWPLPNVWLGTSVEDQASANDRIPLLLNTPATVRFISAEPLLGPIDFTRLDVGGVSTIDALAGFYSNDIAGISGKCNSLDWVITGGESGPNPLHPDWARSIRDQCQASGTAFFHKQNGSWIVTYDRDQEDPGGGSLPTLKNKRERYLNLSGLQHPEGERVLIVQKASKKKSGRLLDGREHNEWPRAV